MGLLDSPFAGGLITGGASLIGSLFGSQTSASNTQAQIENQNAMMDKSMAYNTQMSNTAYQRASADMQAAGLNPMMMAQGGMSASTPTVATPTAPTPQTKSGLEGLGTAASQAVSTAVQMKTMDKMTDEIANLKAENAKIIADVDLSRAHATQATASAGDLDQSAKLKTAQRQAVETNMPVIADAAVSARNRLAINQTARQIMDQAEAGGKKISGAISPLNDLIGSARGAQRIYNGGW